MTSQHILRQQAKAARRALSVEQRQQASAQICETLISLCSSATHIAVYLAMPEEVNLQSLMDWAFSENKKIYVPVIDEASSQLAFFQIMPGTIFQKNSWGIPEPVLSEEQQPRSLSHCDVILVPLVAFDDRLNRIGMGAGLYDRVLSACLPQSTRPFFIGCAFQCQQVFAIQRHEWDVALDAVVTESRHFIQRQDASIARA